MGKQKTLPTFVLCTEHMTSETAAAIQAATPATWRIREEAGEVRAASLGGHVLFVLGATRSPSRLAIRFTGGSSVGRFYIPLSSFSTFLDSVVPPN